MVLLTILTSLLWYYCAWIPFIAGREQRMKIEFEAKLKAFKLIAVRRYYPSLRKLSFEEIEERYHLDSIYNGIGKQLVRPGPGSFGR